MIKQIFFAIENKLKAHVYFAAWNFFRAFSDKNTGTQNKAKAPFLRLVFKNEVARAINSQNVAIEKTAFFVLDIVKDQQVTDKDDLARMQTLEDITKAIEQAILYPQDNEYIGLNYVKEIRINSAFEEMEDITKIENIVINYEIEVDYLRTLRG